VRLRVRQARLYANYFWNKTDQQEYIYKENTYKESRNK
jgi:hypothetical protein